MKARVSASLRVALAAILLSALVIQAGAQSHSYPEAFQQYQRGRQLEQAGKAADAAKAFAVSLAAVESLLSAQPGNPDLVSLQALNLFRLGRHKDVVTVAQKALASVRDPVARDYRLLETLAESQYFLGDSEAALKNFASYMELAPASDDRMSSAYYYVGECYLRLKKYEHADIAFSTATTMENGMFYWWYRLGIAKENLSKYKQAYDSFGRALSLNSGFQIAREAQARVKAKAGL